MSLIEEVMRRSAHERTAATPGNVLSSTRIGRQSPVAPPQLPENFVPVQYRPAAVDPQAMERNRVLLRGRMDLNYIVDYRAIERMTASASGARDRGDIMTTTIERAADRVEDMVAHCRSRPDQHDRDVARQRLPSDRAD